MFRTTERIIRHLQGSRFLYSTQAWQRAAALMALRIPIISPPVTAVTFDPRWMEGKRLLVFKLHGYPDRADWYGIDTRGWTVTALTPDLVRKANLAGAVVIAVVCHAAGSEMESAFFDAGARAVFAAPGEVRGREREPGETDILVKYLLRTLARSPQDLSGALASAKEIYRTAKDVLTKHDLFTLDTFGVTEKGETHGRARV